ncbi:hypothetical protein GX831_00700 [bacterium]|jgi:hypothetical protein|nr:hypothetical protein [bacterium]
MTEDTESNETKNSIIKDVPDSTLRIEIDNDKRLTELQKSLEEKSAKIAVMEYERTHNSFGAPKAPVGGDTAMLNEFYQEKQNNQSSGSDDWQTRTYNSEQELYQTVSKKAKEGNSEAQAIERQLFNKLRKDGLDYEFYGDTHALYRQPKPILPNMTKEQIEYTKQKNAELMAEKAKWRKVQ